MTSFSINIPGLLLLWNLLLYNLYTRLFMIHSTCMIRSYQLIDIPFWIINVVVLIPQEMNIFCGINTIRDDIGI